MILALVNIQMKHYIKDYLPDFKFTLLKDSTLPQKLNCYGMYLEPPTMKHYAGGWVL